MNFESYKNGYTHQKRLFVETPSGMYGLAMNLADPLFSNRDFRKAVQHMFNFDELNEKLMYGAYYRQVSAFEGTEYANPELKAYGFDPRKAREYLIKAGFRRRGPDGILVNDKGERASFELTYGSKSFERHLTVVKEGFRKFGVEMKLKLLEGATAFNRGLERKYQIIMFSRTASLYPSPKQYFHSEFVKTTNNNNVFGFGRPDTDKLIETYMFDLDFEARRQATYELDKIIQDDAFYLPFWTSPYIRFVYWHYMGFPDWYFPRRTEQYLDWMPYWIDPARQKELEDAQKAGTPLPMDSVIDVDPYNIRARFETKK